ncbi:MAG: hypothetical protein JW832_12725 [Deltaproteobacteria bacterium]|nr:hypothetical protein [Deltaproteobacteria bacterium]
MKKPGLPTRTPGIPLNELDKLFYSWELLGGRPFSRILFEFKGGHIDIGLLRQAYALEIQRRPVLNAIIAENPSGSGWDVRWLPRACTDENPAVRLCDFSGMTAEAAENKIQEILFDPFTDYSSRKNPPLSLALCTLPDERQKLLAFINHALTDAHGLGLIFQELFAAYTQLAAGLAPEVSEGPDTGLPPSPLLPESRVKRWMLALGALAFFTGQCIRTGFQGPAKLYSGKNSFSDATAAVQREIATQQLNRYLAAAKRQGITLNVLLVAAQILAIDRWKQARGKAAGVISIDVHKNLRMAEHEFLELSNKFSTFIISTKPRHRTRLKDLLQYVRREQEKAQRDRTAEKIICLLSLLNTRIASKTVPLWGNFVFNNPALGESSQVTNAGRLWAGPGTTTRITHLGDAEIAGCYMAAMPSPSIGNFSGFITFNNKLYLSFNYFNRTMTAEQGQQFMALFEKSLEDLAGCT